MLQEYIVDDSIGVKKSDILRRAVVYNEVINQHVLPIDGIFFLQVTINTPLIDRVTTINKPLIDRVTTFNILLIDIVTTINTPLIDRVTTINTPPSTG